MKTQGKAGSFESVFIFQLLFTMAVFGAWGVNAYKFSKCDFEPSYKAEILHGLGLFIPTFIVTAFMDIE